MLEQLHANNFFFERFHSQPPMHDLLADPEVAIEELGERIAAADGRAAILVHPFYTGGWAPHYPVDDHYRRQLGVFVTEVNEEGLPLIIFEVSSKVAKLNHRMPHREQSGFLVRTTSHDAVPDVFPQQSLSPVSQEAKNHALDRLIARSLRDNNAKRVLIGGRYLFMDTIYHSGEVPRQYERFIATVGELESGRAWTRRSLYPNGCVGTVVKSLFRNGIEVDIAPATSPRIPLRDVRDSEPVLQAGELF